MEYYFLSHVVPYFCRKLGKMSQNLSSAAVVIGPLRVNEGSGSLGRALDWGSKGC